MQITRYTAAVHCTNPLQPSLGSLSRIAYQILKLFWSQRFYFGVGTQRRKLRACVFEDRSNLFTAKLTVSYVGIWRDYLIGEMHWFDLWCFKLLLLNWYERLMCWLDFFFFNPSSTPVCFLLAFVSIGKCNSWAEICYFITSVIRVIKSVVCLKPQSVTIRRWSWGSLEGERVL